MCPECLPPGCLIKQPQEVLQLNGVGGVEVVEDVGVAGVEDEGVDNNAKKRGQGRLDGPGLGPGVQRPRKKDKSFSVFLL